MPESNVDLWKSLGIHHKTAEKLGTLKLSPEKAKEIPDADLKEKYGLNDETVAKIRGAVSGSPPVKETAAKKVDDKKDEDKPAKKPKMKEKGSETEGMPQTLEEKKKILAKLVKDSNGLLKMGSDPEMRYGKRSTGFTALDALLTDGSEQGGFPIGKFTLIAGGWQTCKSALAMAHMAKTMRDDPNCIGVWGDAENSFDAPWAAKQGIDLDRLVVVPAMIADHMIMKIEEVIESVGPSCVVVDSIGSLLSWQEVMKDRDDDEYTKDVSQDTMALTARFLSKLYRRWTPLIAKFKMTFVFITHIYNVIGQAYTMEEAKGGNAMKHSSHVTIWTSRRKGDQEQKAKIKMPDGRVVELFTAYEAVFTINKTRQSPTEGQKVAIPFVYGKGLSETESVIDLALKVEGVLETKGSWYSHASFLPVLNGANNGWVNGRENTAQFIRENPTVFEAILASVGKIMAADDVAEEVEPDAPAA